MRRHRRQLPASGFRGGELRWLISGILMLVVLALLMSRLREPGVFNWMSSLGKPTAVPQPQSPASPLPTATGPTDEDTEQTEAVQEEFGALSDGTLTLGPEEMVPYNRLVFWVKNQSFARLWARAKKDLAYTYLYDEADKYRGRLVALDVQIRVVRNAEKNQYNIPLHEVWATTAQSGDRLYDLVVLDLPAKMPIGGTIPEHARFAGYFLKLQGYHPAMSKPGAAPEKAPLLIGRLEWTPSAAAPASDNSQEWIWGSAALAVIAIVLAVRFVYGRLRRREATARGILAPPSDAVIPVDRWLEQSGFAAHEAEKTDDRDGGAPSSSKGP